METTLRPANSLPIYRLGGAAFMLGNALFIANKWNEMSRLFLGKWTPDVISGGNPLLILVGQAALIAGYAAWYRAYAPQIGRSGKYALRLFCGGGILLAVAHAGFIRALGRQLPAAILPYAESFFIFILLGLALLLAGLIWFGALNLRWRVLTRWQWLPLLTGLLGFFGFFLISGEQINATFLVFRTLFALGLIGMGFVLYLEK